MPSDPTTTEAVIHTFNQAFQRHEPALLAGLIAPDCVLENSAGAPDGERFTGRDACLALWQGIAGNRDARFELEETRTAGEQAVIFWRYRWGPGHADSVRGVNVMRVQGGLIVEGRGYVKAGAGAMQ